MRNLKSWYLFNIMTLFSVTMMTRLVEAAEPDSGLPPSPQFFTVEGKVAIPQSLDLEWIPQTRILVDGGKYLGFLKEDGSFVVTNVPAG